MMFSIDDEDIPSTSTSSSTKLAVRNNNVEVKVEEGVEDGGWGSLSSEDLIIYENCKRKITGWENNFIKSQGRKPTKEDMRIAPNIIRESYSKYREIRNKKYSNEDTNKKLTKKEETEKKERENSVKFFGGIKIKKESPAAGKKSNPRKKQVPSYPMLEQSYSFRFRGKDKDKKSSTTTTTVDADVDSTIKEGKDTNKDNEIDLDLDLELNDIVQVVDNIKKRNFTEAFSSEEDDGDRDNELEKKVTLEKMDWSSIVNRPRRKFLKDGENDEKSTTSENLNSMFDDNDEEILWPSNIQSTRRAKEPTKTVETNKNHSSLSTSESQSASASSNKESTSNSEVQPLTWEKKPERPRKFFKSKTRSEREESLNEKKFDYIKSVFPKDSIEEKKTKKKQILKAIKAKKSPVVSSKTKTKAASSSNESELKSPKIVAKKTLKQTKSKKSTTKTSSSKRKGNTSSSVRKTRSKTATDDNKKDNINEPSLPNPLLMDIFDIPEDEGTENKPKKKMGNRNRPTRAKGENYVKINIEKKVFVRGRKGFNRAKMRQKEIKNKYQAARAASRIKALTCGKCGEFGHPTRLCQKDHEIHQAPFNNRNNDEDEENVIRYPTLKDAAALAFSQKAKESAQKNSKTSIFLQPPIDDPESQKIVQELEEVRKKVLDDAEKNHTRVENENETIEEEIGVSSVPCFFTQVNDDEKSYSMLDEALHEFGYEFFREGQKEAIVNILQGKSSLAILSTGSGKSLIYQLPAYLYAKVNPESLVLCISPLVSLMDDQSDRMPDFLKAGCLHSNMTKTRRQKVIDKIKAREINILIVSPEAVCRGFFGLLKDAESFPPIAFACIDEAHCVSQWSHNFRPSYFRVCKLLRDNMGVNLFLGLTATATEYTALSICDHLSIAKGNIIQGEIIPANLNLSVSRDMFRDVALVRLLNSPRFEDCDSVIIYCTRRDECERISSLVRTNLQHLTIEGRNESKVGRHRISSICECYHAGLSAPKRRSVQTQFMNGEIRVVVATVAFGMGLDKSDIRAVIHYNMPKAFESYVQEIGRAGRDGKPAQCHLFLDNTKDKDLNELKRHVYSNSVDRSSIRILLNKIFNRGICKKIQKISGTKINTNATTPACPCPWHEVALNINELVTELNITEETITTLLCYLELNKERKWLEQYPHCYERVKIHSYTGPKQFRISGQTCPPLACGLALQLASKKFKENDAYLEFNTITASSLMGWKSSVVKRELKSLEWIKSDYDEQGNPSKFRKSGFLVEFDELAFRVSAPCDLASEEKDTVLDFLHNHVMEQEKVQLYQLYRIYTLLVRSSSLEVTDALKDFDKDKSELLKEHIKIYFKRNTRELPSTWKIQEYGKDKEQDIRNDVNILLRSLDGIDINGRSVAKIFQGITTPNFPAEYWARNKHLWRRHLDVEFNYLCRIATDELSRNT